MKYIGFLKEHDKNIRNANFLIDLLNKNDRISYKDNIIEYLNHGHFVIGVMSYVCDNNNIIGTSDYFTDGVYLWPRYFSYYILNYNISVDKDFIQHVCKNNFKIGEVSNQTLSDIEDDFIKEWSGKY